jgi:hypothetical protein
MGTSIHGITC